MKGSCSPIFLLFAGLTIFLNGCRKDVMDIPILTTAEISAIDVTNAISGGSIISDGGTNITARGVCWSTTSSPTLANSFTTNGNGLNSFVSSLTGLIASTKYFVRAYATNNEGTAYGNEFTFTTITTFVCGTNIKDIDGNEYTTISIGDQCWIKENLKTGNYNDGSVISNGLSNTSWIYATSGAYAIYGNNVANNATFGKLYNWYAVETDKLCPIGWHIPTDAEWTTLTSYLGGEQVAGGKLKSTINWQLPNAGATNSSGFSGFPGGYRFDIRTSPNIGYYGNWWSSTSTSTYSSWGRSLGYYGINVGRSSYSNVNGLSCRCIRD